GNADGAHVPDHSLFSAALSSSSSGSRIESSAARVDSADSPMRAVCGTGQAGPIVGKTFFFPQPPATPDASDNVSLKNVLQRELCSCRGSHIVRPAPARKPQH